MNTKTIRNLHIRRLKAQIKDGWKILSAAEAGRITLSPLAEARLSHQINFTAKKLFGENHPLTKVTEAKLVFAQQKLKSGGVKGAAEALGLNSVDAASFEAAVKNIDMSEVSVLALASEVSELELAYRIKGKISAPKLKLQEFMLNRKLKPLGYKVRKGKLVKIQPVKPKVEKPLKLATELTEAFRKMWNFIDRYLPAPSALLSFPAIPFSKKVGTKAKTDVQSEKLDISVSEYVLDAVASADLISNRNAVMEVAYLETVERLDLRGIPEARRTVIDKLASEFNPLTDSFESVSTTLQSSAEASYFEITLYRKLGGRTDSLSAKLQTIDGAESGNSGIDSATISVIQSTAISDALTKQIRQLKGISTQFSQKLKELRLIIDAKTKWSIIQELLQNQVPGMSAHDLWKRAAGQIRNPKGAQGEPFTLEMFQARLREGVDNAVNSQVQRVDLTPELFKGSPAPIYEVDRLTVNRVAQDATRAREHGHTLGDSYLHRHITPETLKFLRDNPNVKIRIYDGAPGKVMHHLQHNGFTDVKLLSDNKLTDFHKYIARNPSTGETSLVVIGPKGRAYPKEITAHFFYGSNAISPSRITILRSPVTARVEFTATLKRANVDPDVLMIGNVAQFCRLMNERGIEPVGVIKDPNLFGFIYEINGKTVLAVKVEPHLYADRAGEFVQAVLGQSEKKRSIFFTGTAGSLRADIEVYDLVVPSEFSDANGLESVAIGGVKNDAIALTRDAQLQRTGVFTEGRLGAVDTIMTEDMAWFDSHTRGNRRLDIVEQEGAGIAQAIKEHRAARGEEAPVEFHAVYRISDNLVTGEDFAGNEFNRPEPRSGLTQADFINAILKRIFGPTLQATPTRARVPEVMKLRKSRYQITPEGDGSNSSRLTLNIENFETLNLIDKGAAQSLLTQTNRIVAGLRVSEGRIVNQATIQRDLANLALEYQRQFGIKVSFSLSGVAAQPQKQVAIQN